MKKVAVALVILLTLISLCGCKYRFDYEELVKNVQKIEIIEYNSETEEEKLLTTIAESVQKELLLDLSELDYSYFYGPPKWPDGRCIKLIYTNDSFEIISWYGTTKKQLIKCNQISFEEMLQKYYSD